VENLNGGCVRLKNLMMFSCSDILQEVQESFIDRQNCHSMRRFAIASLRRAITMLLIGLGLARVIYDRVYNGATIVRRFSLYVFLYFFLSEESYVTHTRRVKKAGSVGCRSSLPLL